MSYTYHPKRNPHDYAIPGVPLRDLSAEDLAALPERLQRAVAQSPYYSADAPAAPEPVVVAAEPEAPAPAPPPAKGKRGE